MLRNRALERRRKRKNENEAKMPVALFIAPFVEMMQQRVVLLLFDAMHTRAFTFYLPLILRKRRKLAFSDQQLMLRICLLHFWIWISFFYFILYSWVVRVLLGKKVVIGSRRNLWSTEEYWAKWLNCQWLNSKSFTIAQKLAAEAAVHICRFLSSSSSALI